MLDLDVRSGSATDEIVILNRQLTHLTNQAEAREELISNLSTRCEGLKSHVSSMESEVKQLTKKYAQNIVIKNEFIEDFNDFYEETDQMWQEIESILKSDM